MLGSREKKTLTNSGKSWDFAEVIFSGSPKVCILTRIALLNIWGKGHGKRDMGMNQEMETL